MSGPRQKIQYTQQRLALAPARRGEPPTADRPGTEPLTAKRTTDRPAAEDQLMEEVCDRSNLEKAWKRVRGNKGSPGVDGLTIDDTATYLREHWPTIRAQLLAGTYTPQPVKRVDIPKPTGGVRRLGVPCVVDRLIQQALLQVLQEQWDPTFSEYSYGFRPGRSAHQAVAQAQKYVADGYDVVVDIDLEKFFDRVNQDRLVARVAERVSDKRVLKLIDPEHVKHWVVLVDGAETQLDLVEASAAAYGVDVTVILDIIHVVEYVWKAAHAFHHEGSPDAAHWAWTRVQSILEGKSSKVAAAMRRAATVAGLSSDTRKPVDTCADYLQKYAPYLHYDRYLAAGYPIATGVIEGACRYLVRDRMELTGARWRLVGAEAVLKLRALRASGDFDAYWDFHEAREYERNHAQRYAERTVPPVSEPPPPPSPPRLRRVK